MNPRSAGPGSVASRIGVAGLGVLILAAGCSDEIPTIPPGEGPAPAFSLPDVNTTSTRFGEMVSPRDYEGQVSAWYFGHAT